MHSHDYVSFSETSASRVWLAGGQPLNNFGAETIPSAAEAHTAGTNAGRAEVTIMDGFVFAYNNRSHTYYSIH